MPPLPSSDQPKSAAQWNSITWIVFASVMVGLGVGMGIGGHVLADSAMLCLGIGWAVCALAFIAVVNYLRSEARLGHTP